MTLKLTLKTLDNNTGEENKLIACSIGHVYKWYKMHPKTIVNTYMI